MIRNEVREHLADLIAGSAVAGSVDVSSYFPGDKHTTAEMIFGDRTSGSVTFPYGMASPKIQRDLFTVVFVVRVTARPSLADAMTRCGELADAVVSILADDASLLGFEANGEEVTDTNPDGIQVDTREGETKTGVTLALAEITVPIETQTKNEEG